MGLAGLCTAYEVEQRGHTCVLSIHSSRRRASCAARRIGTGIPIAGAGGAFAWFTPGQHTALHRHLIMPEGHIFFAGEHISLTHTWMQGALESALQAVRDMLASSRR